MKKFLVVVAAVFLANISEAAYLYWQVSTSELSGKTDSVTGESLSGLEFNYAQIIAVDSSGKETALMIANPMDGTSMATSKMNLSVDGPYAINLSQLSNPAAYSFYIELLNYNNTSYDFVAKSDLNFDKSSYANLVDGKYIDVGDTFQLPQANVWHGGSYTATPEPTSAMLVMFGMGLLALKRKRV